MLASVLVVEDDDDIRHSLRLLLEGNRYLVYEAPDGRPALDHLRSSPESLVVLLDLQMRGMDGAHVLQTLADDLSLFARHVIVVMTAYCERTLPPAVAHLLVEHRIPILAKPFDVNTLLAAIGQAQARLSVALACRLDEC